MRLTGKVAVVTGGGNGIGAAIATRMAEEGAAVVIVDVDAEGGKRVAAGLPDASFYHGDVTDEDAVAAVFAAVVKRHGRLDVLVNNAGLAGLNVPTDEVTNCAFGGDDRKTLYVTGGGTLYTIRTTTPGRLVWPVK